MMLRPVSYTHLDVYKRQEWDRSGASKASVIISIEEVDGINDKLKEIIYQTQKSVDEDELTFKQSMAKSKRCV